MGLQRRGGVPDASEVRLNDWWALLAVNELYALTAAEGSISVINPAGQAVPGGSHVRYRACIAAPRRAAPPEGAASFFVSTGRICAVRSLADGNTGALEGDSDESILSDVGHDYPHKNTAARGKVNSSDQQFWNYQHRKVSLATRGQRHSGQQSSSNRGPPLYEGHAPYLPPAAVTAQQQPELD